MNRRGFFKTLAVSALSAVGVGKLLSILPFQWTHRLHSTFFVPQIAIDHARNVFMERLRCLEEHGAVEIDWKADHPFGEEKK